MAKIIKSEKWEYSEAELHRMYEAATRRGEEAIKLKSKLTQFATIKRPIG